MNENDFMSEKNSLATKKNSLKFDLFSQSNSQNLNIKTASENQKAGFNKKCLSQLLTQNSFNVPRALQKYSKQTLKISN